MCIIYKNLKSTTKTGYKVMAWDGKSFYSIFTGQRFRVGKVPQPPKGMCKPLTRGWCTDLYMLGLKQTDIYSKDFAGKTAVFTDFDDVMGFIQYHPIDMGYKDRFRLVVVKINFDCDCYMGNYGPYRIIAGDTIKSIDIVETHYT